MLFVNRFFAQDLPGVHSRATAGAVGMPKARCGPPATECRRDLSRSPEDLSRCSGTCGVDPG